MVEGRKMMRTFAAVVTAAMVLAACSGEDTSAPPAEDPTVESSPTGDLATAPSVEFETFDGDVRRLADFHAETPVVVNFWASWCPPCVAEMPEFEEVHQQFASRVTLLGINTQDTAEKARELAEQTGVTYPLAWDPDGDLFAAFSVFSMPSTFVVDTDGRIVDRHSGPLTGDDLVAMIERALAGAA